MVIDQMNNQKLDLEISIECMYGTHQNTIIMFLYKELGSSKWQQHTYEAIHMHTQPGYTNLQNSMNNKCNRPTFTAVRRVISFPIRSTSTGRHADNSALRLSPNVDTTSPMQEIAHSLTSWVRRNISHSTFYTRNTIKEMSLTWSWSWFVKRDIMALYIGRT